MKSLCFVWASLFSVSQFFVVLFVAAGFSLRTFSKLSLNAAFVNGVVLWFQGFFSPGMHISILMLNVLVKHSSDQTFKN